MKFGCLQQFFLWLYCRNQLQPHKDLLLDRVMTRRGLICEAWYVRCWVPQSPDVADGGPLQWCACHNYREISTDHSCSQDPENCISKMAYMQYYMTRWGGFTASSCCVEWCVCHWWWPGTRNGAATIQACGTQIVCTVAAWPPGWRQQSCHSKLLCLGK